MQITKRDTKSQTAYSKWAASFKQDIFSYLLLFPALAIIFVFHYLPMPGIIVAFKDYDMFQGVLKSPWVGLTHIIDIFRIPALSMAVVNTLKLSLLTLVVGFPAPIVLALLINEIRGDGFKRVVQTMSYLPHFLSWISVVGLTYAMFANYGPINDLRVLLLGQGTERIMFLSKQELFMPIVLLLNVWKEVGWGTVVYLAAITSIDPGLYEAAYIDGASRFQQTIKITIPSILPTTIILLIFSLGGLFKSNFELIYGMQNPYINFDVISTIVYTTGIKDGNYSMAAALGFMEGLIALLLVLGSNYFSKKVSNIAII